MSTKDKDVIAVHNKIQQWKKEDDERRMVRKTMIVLVVAIMSTILVLTIEAYKDKIEQKNYEKAYTISQTYDVDFDEALDIISR